MKRHAKWDFRVSKLRRYLEPGPIVLVSSHCEGKHNIMTLGWHTVLEFSPSLVGCMISGGNHSFEMIRQSRECVINLPTLAAVARFNTRLAEPGQRFSYSSAESLVLGFVLAGATGR